MLAGLCITWCAWSCQYQHQGLHRLAQPHVVSKQRARRQLQGGSSSSSIATAAGATPEGFQAAWQCLAKRVAQALCSTGDQSLQALRLERMHSAPTQSTSNAVLHKLLELCILKLPLRSSTWMVCWRPPSCSCICPGCCSRITRRATPPCWKGMGSTFLQRCSLHAGTSRTKGMTQTT
jgi:hypothetical protein